MQTKNAIGKKIRITGEFYKNNIHFSQFYGKIGTVIDQHGSVLEIKMSDGHILRSFSPYHETPECEFVNVRWEDILSNKIAIHCPTLELFIKVNEIINSQGIEPLSHGYWYRYGDKICVKIDSSTNMALIGSKDYFIDNNYEIIEAQDFIDENSIKVNLNITNNTNMEQALIIGGSLSLKKAFIEELTTRGYKPLGCETINSISNKDECDITINLAEKKFSAERNSIKSLFYKLPEQWDIALKKIDEGIENNTIKAGDYVVALDTYKATGSYLEGEVYKVRDINFGSVSTEIDSNGSTDNGWGITQFRKATQAEIEKYKNIVRTIFIGDNNQKVSISKNGIFVEGREILPTTIMGIINRMKRSGYNINNWNISYNTINIGCCNNITLKQLEDGMRIYDELLKK